MERPVSATDSDGGSSSGNPNSANDCRDSGNSERCVSIIHRHSDLVGPSLYTVCCALGAALGVAPPSLGELSQQSSTLYELISGYPYLNSTVVCVDVVGSDTYMAMYRPFKCITMDEQYVGFTSLTEESLLTLRR